MASEGLCCGLFRGSIYLRDLSDPQGALLPIGNAEANITQTLTEISQDNFQQLGGKACSVEYPESSSVEMVVHCTKPENLAIAFMGEARQRVADNVSGEKHTVHSEGELIAFENAPDLTKPVVVTDGASTTFVEGVDYSITRAGLIILSGTSIPMHSDIEVDYSHGANWVVDMQTASQKEFEFVMDGMNVGSAGNKAVVAKLWKVKFAPTDNFTLIGGSEFNSINLNGEILTDQSRPIGSKMGQFEFGVTNSQGY